MRRAPVEEEHEAEEREEKPEGDQGEPWQRSKGSGWRTQNRKGSGSGSRTYLPGLRNEVGAEKLLRHLRVRAHH